ncbi:Spy/CpxP family protein refolding chaperone [Melioribacter sp. OK-6-Me]|uniref:Spy/CpxP family protein refolding chaperone n=1 Tax=unclassified Melioribacter TaxID=2627329 RepID=UPI003EDA2195
MKKLFSLVLVLLLVVPALNIAQPFDGKGRMPLCDKLNLTEEQQKRIDELRYELREKLIDLKAELQKNRLELRKMKSQSQIDEKQYMQLVEKSNTLRSNIRTETAKHWLAVYNLLDDNQKELWAKYRNDYYGFGKRFNNNYCEGQPRFNRWRR